MKLQATIADTSLDVELLRDGRKVVANVDGRDYELDVSEPETGIYLLKDGNRVFETMTSPANTPGAFDVIVGGEPFEVKIIDRKRLRAAAAESAAADGIAEVRSAMPGKIVRVLVTGGETVEKGQGVIVVEAMKMQNELKSPKAGLIKEL